LIPETALDTEIDSMPGIEAGSDTGIITAANNDTELASSLSQVE
jgi:hypothetical protein